MNHAKLAELLRSAQAALLQTKTFPADVALAKARLADAIRLAEEEIALDQVAARRGEFAFTLRELHAAFDRVKRVENWKLAIDRDVQLTRDADACEREVAAIREAVVFFTGSVADVRHVGNFRFRVRAAGYYTAVGA